MIDKEHTGQGLINCLGLNESSASQGPLCRFQECRWGPCHVLVANTAKFHGSYSWLSQKARLNEPLAAECQYSKSPEMQGHCLIPAVKVEASATESPSFSPELLSFSIGDNSLCLSFQPSKPTSPWKRLRMYM